MGRPKKDDTGIPTNIRLSEPLMAQLKAAAERLDWPVQMVIREALKLGLEDWKRCDYDLAGSVMDRVETSRDEEIALVAEKGAGYSVKKARNAIKPTAIPTSFFVVTRAGKS